VKTVEETGKNYMIGETSYYYPCSIYCRERYMKGDFGQIVYAEGEYMHDFVHGLYDVYKSRLGQNWQRHAGIPPMFYPTHSMSMVVSVTGAHVTHVSGMGFEDHNEDGLFGKDKNIYHNPFSNETALCKMSDGSVSRFNEFRRIGHPGEVRMSMYGTKGSYEEQYNSRIWVTSELRKFTELSGLLCAADDRNFIDLGNGGQTVDGDWLAGNAAKIQPVDILPKEYKDLHNGHKGSHQFLIHEFVSACVNNVQPVNNVWQAARYLIPGLIAHESAMRGGILMEVPDLGDGKDNNICAAG
ncbi:MAG: gfo/Idh/MocA family oxidoreductase, partial [Candidatus Paceibacterota bacterium]